ncbi:MAG: DUF2267 domain-containing protein [Methyloligella sp. ZOD6]
MSATGLDVFDKTLQTTNSWLNEIGETIGPDRQKSYHALRAVLFALRDRLPPEESAHLASQLPILVRGIYYDGYEPTGKPEKIRSEQEFLAKVSEHLQAGGPIDPDDATRAVFRLLEAHIADGEIGHVKHALPEGLRSFFTH